MRKHELMSFVDDVIKQRFAADVAEALLSDSMIDAVATRLNDVCNGNPNAIKKRLGEIAKELTDSLADWLVYKADSPAGWLYSQI